jgi:hypothetical protein
MRVEEGRQDAWSAVHGRAMLVGNMGAVRPAIIWAAMIMSKTPATIEMPGAIATTVHTQDGAEGPVVQGSRQPSQRKMVSRRLVMQPVQ